MTREPIDPTPFIPAMPASVRDLIEEGRAGRGPAAAWLHPVRDGWGQVGVCFGLLRSSEPSMGHQEAGWLVGMAMFGDDLHTLPKIILRERHEWAIPGVLDAVAAGVRAGVPGMPRQWTGIEALVARLAAPPEALVSVLPIALASDQALTRGCALRIAQRAKESASRAIAEARTSVKGKVARRLDEALVALKAPDEARVVSGGSDAPAEDLLGRMLEAWRNTRDPALGDAAVLVGTSIARDRGPIRARSKGELEGVWAGVAAGKDPADVSRLLAAPWPGAWKVALERVKALARFPADPRIVRGLLEVAPRYTSMGSHPLHRAIAEVALTADPSCATALDALATARTYRGAGEEYAKAAENARATGSSEAPRELLEEARRTTKPSDMIGELWDAFYAEPTDPARRLVLADALQSVGDPRGELIAIQTAISEGRGDIAARRRANELLATHIDEWSGKVPGVDRASRRFERGFLVAARIIDRAGVEAAGLERAWRTIEELEIERWAGHSGDLPALVARLPLLRVLSTPSDAVLASLAEGPPLPSLRALGDAVEWLPPPKSRGLPHLAVLLVGSTTWGAWDDGAFRALLERVAPLDLRALVYRSGAIPDVRMPIVAFREARGGVPLELRLALCNEPGFHPRRWRMRVRRDSPRVDVAWAGGPDHIRSGLAPLLMSLVGDAGCQEVVVDLGRDRDIDDKARAAIAALTKHGKSVRLDGEPIDLAAVPET